MSETQRKRVVTECGHCSLRSASRLCSVDAIEGGDYCMKVAIHVDEVGVQAQQIGGDHYVRHAIQPWDAMREWMTPAEFQGFLRGNAIKYIARCTDKGGVEDIEKAVHYLQQLAQEMRKCS